MDKVNVNVNMPDIQLFGAHLHPVGNDIFIVNPSSYYVFDSDVDSVKLTHNGETGATRIVKHDKWVLLLRANEIAAYNNTEERIVWTKSFRVNYTDICFLKENSVQLVVETSGEIELVTLELETGKEVSSKPFFTLENGDVYSYVGITENHVFTAFLQRDSIWGFRKDNPNEVLWKIPYNNRHNEEESLLATNELLLVADGEKLMSFSLDSGALMSTYQAPATIKNVKYQNGRVYIFTSDSFICLDPNGFREHFKVSTGLISDPYVQDNKLICFSDKVLKAFDLNTGELIKKLNLEPVVSVTNAVFIKGQYIFASQEGEIVKVEE